MKWWSAIAVVGLGCAESKPKTTAPWAAVDPPAVVTTPAAPASPPPKPGIVPTDAQRKVRSGRGQCLSATELPTLVDCNKSGTFRFLLTRDEHYMVQAAGGHCLELGKDTAIRGECDGSPMVTFTLREVPGGVLVASGEKCLTDDGSSTASVRPCTGDTSQLWSLPTE